MKKFVRRITASTDNNVADKISELQDVSNELVDSILELIDNLPEIARSIAEYERENAAYGGSIVDELHEKLDWIIKETKDIVHDVQGISDYFIH